MERSTLFLFALIALSVYIVPTEANSKEQVENEEKIDLSNPTEEASKSAESELEVEEKSSDDGLTPTEARMERSTESASDKSVVSDGVETDLNNAEPEVSTIEDNLKTVSDLNESVETSTIDEKISEINDAAEEMSSERSITELDDEELNNNSRDGNNHSLFGDDNSKSGDEMKEINEKNIEDHLNTATESSYFKSQEIHDMLLDNKGRSAGNSNENLGIQASSETGAEKIAFGGSRRSNSVESARSSSPLTSSRSGQIFEDIPLSNPSHFMLNKIINQEIPRPNEYVKSPISTSGERKPQDKMETYFDPISSSEFKPLEEFTSNTFSNAYPYAFQPLTTTTQRPIESNRYHEIGLLPKITQPLENLKRPIAKYIGENFNTLPPVPVSYYGSKPQGQNLQFPNFNSYKNRFNQYPSQPAYYYKKCTYCS